MKEKILIERGTAWKPFFSV